MRKYVKYGICGLAVLMLLAGCSKKDGETAADTTAAESTVAESTEESTTAAEEQAVDPGTVTLGDYKGLEIEGMSTEVTDEEVEEEIGYILAANPDYIEITDRPAELGDTVNIDYVGMKDGVAFEGGTAEGYDLELGSDSFIDGFEDGLVGVKKGDEISLNLTFPENYPSEDLAGQEVVFDVTVNSVEEVKDAELNDDFVQKISDFTTVEEFRADILAELVSYKEQQADYDMKSKALQAAMENAEYNVNQEAVQVEFDRYYSASESQAAMYGMSLDDMLSAYGMTADSYKEQLQSDAEGIVKQQLLVSAIMEAENLELTDEARQKVADSEGMGLAELNETYGQEEVDRVAQIHIVVEFLADNAVIK